MSPTPAQCAQPHMSGGGISRKISDRFPADLPRVGMENDLLDWGFCIGGSAWHRVHPRSRREYPSATVIAFESRGSSLLTRGTPGPREEQSQRERIIPAYAGNTPSDLCKHHTAQADYGSAVERLPLSYSFYRTPTTKEAQLESLVRHRYERPQAHQTSNQ